MDLSKWVAEASYLVAPEAEFLNDHFPDAAMVPGVVMLEIAVQAATLLLTEKLGKTAQYDLNFLERLHLTRRVTPNERLVVSVQITDISTADDSAACKARASVAGEIAMQASFRIGSHIREAN